MHETTYLASSPSSRRYVRVLERHRKTPNDSGQEAAQPVYLLAWIPETLLNEKGQSEWDKFTRIEESTGVDDEDEGTCVLTLIMIHPSERTPRCRTH